MLANKSEEMYQKCPAALKALKKHSGTFKIEEVWHHNESSYSQTEQTGSKKGISITPMELQKVLCRRKTYQMNRHLCSTGLFGVGNIYFIVAIKTMAHVIDETWRSPTTGFGFESVFRLMVRLMVIASIVIIKETTLLLPSTSCLVSLSFSAFPQLHCIASLISLLLRMNTFIIP